MTTKMTVTEALAEITTIGKRIEKAQVFVYENLARPSIYRDPLEKDGGTKVVIDAKLQSISDLQDRIIALRTAIQDVNSETSITIGGESKTIAEWLVWRRDVAPMIQERLAEISNRIGAARRNIENMNRATAPNRPNPLTPYQKGAEGGDVHIDLNVYVDEKILSDDIELLEQKIGDLDGQLSLKNATIFIEIAD